MLKRTGIKEEGKDVYVLEGKCLYSMNLVGLTNCIIYLTEKQMNAFESLENGYACMCAYKEAFQRNIDIRVKKSECLLNS